MPASAAGHGTARLKARVSPQIGRQDPHVPPPSRRKSAPPAAPRAKLPRSRETQIARQPACRRQIPIDRTGRTAAPNPPAVSSPEACPTPADRVRGTRPATAGVRQPLTTADLQRHAHLRPLSGVKQTSNVRFLSPPHSCADDVCFQGQSGPPTHGPKESAYSQTRTYGHSAKKTPHDRVQ